jgi:hypothetical protein
MEYEVKQIKVVWIGNNFPDVAETLHSYGCKILTFPQTNETLEELKKKQAHFVIITLSNNETLVNQLEYLDFGGRIIIWNEKGTKNISSKVGTIIPRNKEELLNLVRDNIHIRSQALKLLGTGDLSELPLKKLCNKVNILSPNPLIILVLSGSFNPIHRMHLQTFLAAKDLLEKKYSRKVVAGYVSPSSDSYVKQKLKETAMRHLF